MGLSSSTFGILAAMALFAVGLATPLMLLANAPVDDLGYAALEHDADQALQAFVRPPTGNAGDHALLVAPRERVLDEERVAAASRASYEDVRSSVGAPRDFRLTVAPLLRPLGDPAHEPFEMDGVAYMGRQAPLALPILFGSAMDATSSRVNASATVTNVGREPAIFAVEFGLGNALKDLVLLPQTRNTRLLAPNETQTVWVTYHPLTSWDPEISGVRVRVRDSFGGAPVLPDGSAIAPTWRSVSLPTSATGQYNHRLQAIDTFVDEHRKVAFVLDHYGALGLHVAGATGRFTLHGPDGAEWVNRSVDLPAAPGAVLTWECGNCTSTGTYTARLWDGLLTRVQTDRLHYSLPPLFTSQVHLHETAQREAAQVAQLVGTFQPQPHNALLAPEGDVFADRAKGARAVTAHLDRYRTLIVGSDVANSALASHGARTAVDAWVRDGGTLIVLGSRGSAEWMNPLWGISLRDAAGAPVATGEMAVALAQPERLEMSAHDAGGRAWLLSNVSSFQRIVVPAGSPDAATWAVSAPGAFGRGTVALVAFRPGDATAGADAEREGARLLHNVLVHAHTRFYADVGPEVPAGRAVAAADAIVVGRDRLAPGGHAVRLVVHVFE